MPRLPQPGGDTDNWGAVLNEYLQVSHKLDGSLKDDIVNGAVVQNNTLTGSKLQNGTISESKLDAALTTKVNTSGGVTNLGATTTSTSVQVTSSSGAGATLPAASATDAGVLTATDKTKLNGVAPSATSNQTDAYLLNRTNHTGSQSIATVAGLQAALDTKAGTTHTHSLNDLTDVTTSGAALDQVLKYNGTSWAPASDDVSGGAGGANLSTVASASSVTINSDSGTDATISAATPTNAGVLTSADKTKLDGIASGASVNQSDAALLNRANHTGTQAVATVTGLQADLDGKAPLTHTHAAASIISGVISAARLGTGTADNTSYLRGDGTWAVPPVGGGNPAVGGDLSGTASNAQIVAGAVDTTELADSAVSTVKVANDAITEPKLAVSNAPGTNQVLSWNGTAMSWATPATGGSTGFNIRQITTSPVDAASNDWIVANPSAQGITVNLPAPAPNAHVRVKRRGLSGNSIMIATPNGGILDGGEPTMATLNGGWASQDYESDGVDWYNV